MAIVDFGSVLVSVNHKFSKKEIGAITLITGVTLPIQKPPLSLAVARAVRAIHEIAVSVATIVMCLKFMVNSQIELSNY